MQFCLLALAAPVSHLFNQKAHRLLVLYILGEYEELRHLPVVSPKPCKEAVEHHQTPHAMLVLEVADEVVVRVGL